MSQGCAISVAFAVRHPDRVSHLILYGGFARGAYKRAANELELQKAKALASLIRTGWGDDSPAYRQLFASLFMPDATHEQLEKFAERQRKTTTPECAYRYFETTRNLDVTDLLSKVRVPTLVMHVRGDLIQPFEVGRELAAGIPGARFLALQGKNHMLLPQDPTTQRRDQTIFEIAPPPSANSRRSAAASHHAGADAPGFKARIIARQSLSPLDPERIFGLPNGDIFHGAMTLDQVFSARPMQGFAAYRMPIAGLYLCGSGAHPGGDVTGAPGHNAAQTVIADLLGD